MKFEATSGKVRCEGVRKPMVWATPKMMLCGDDLEQHVHRYLKERGDAFAEADFWLPDFVPKNAQLSKVTGLAGGRMPIYRFQRLTAELFKAKGVPDDQVAKFSTYSARRVLPTVGDAAGMTPTERLNIGAWTDPKGKLTKARQRLAMPDRYSDTLVRTKAKAKLKAIMAVKMATEDVRIEEDPEWERVLSRLPTSKALEKRVRALL